MLSTKVARGDERFVQVFQHGTRGIVPLLQLVLSLGLLSSCGEVSKSHDSAPLDLSADKGVVDMVPKDSARPEAAVDLPRPDRAAPDSLALDLPAGDSAAPDQAVADQAAQPPDQQVPDQHVPDQQSPDLLVPDQLVPDQLVPDFAIPDKGPPPKPVLLSGGIGGLGVSSGGQYTLLESSFETGATLCVAGVGCVTGGIRP